MTEKKSLADRVDLCRAVEQVLNIPSSGHASAGELAVTILDALTPALSAPLDGFEKDKADLEAYGMKIVTWPEFCAAKDTPEGLHRRAFRIYNNNENLSVESWVVYDPNADDEGGLLIGERDEIARETVKDLITIEPPEGPLSPAALQTSAKRFVPHDELTPGFWYLRVKYEPGWTVVLIEAQDHDGKLYVVQSEETADLFQFDGQQFIGKVPTPEGF
jgi:hypothetical protein